MEGPLSRGAKRYDSGTNKAVNLPCLGILFAKVLDIFYEKKSEWVI